ncbi:hypothetical protein NDU88_000293 [Pleurodeles waltl]|uniref:Uncharacterized protein n=1 Tax=Pleurodeles waltl TaxID=8319 RepID=A0AAV7Q3Q4_PLEWA|nr:hypothetical protein NDU88_000293 [Pleurodeles waltl]
MVSTEGASPGSGEYRGLGAEWGPGLSTGVQTPAVMSTGVQDPAVMSTGVQTPSCDEYRGADPQLSRAVQRVQDPAVMSTEGASPEL